MSQRFQRRLLPLGLRRRLSTVPTCPPAICACAATPPLAIDRATSLNGTMALYSEQVVLCTGRSDWPSRIEFEPGDNPAADLKALFGRGKYSDPYRPVSVLNSSLPAQSPGGTSDASASAYLLPSFKYVPVLPRGADLRALAGYVRSEPRGREDRDTGKDSYREENTRLGMVDVRDVLIFICGHAARDARCGVMGPLLQREFEVKVAALPGFVVKHGVHAERDGAGSAGSGSDSAVTVRIGLVSHVGGHSFAGNVIMYIPPTLGHALAGCGIWYGRVEPRHVEGLVMETIVRGNVVADHFRGGIDGKRRILRI